MLDTSKKRFKRKQSSKSRRIPGSTPVPSEPPTMVSANDLVALNGPFVPPPNHEISEFRYSDEISLELFYPEFAKSTSSNGMLSSTGSVDGNLPATPASTPIHGLATPIEQHHDEDKLLDMITRSLKLVNLLSNESDTSLASANTSETDFVATSPKHVRRQASSISIGAGSLTTTPGLELDSMDDEDGEEDDDDDDELNDEALLCATPPGLNILIDPTHSLNYNKNHLFKCIQVAGEDDKNTQLEYS